MEFGLPILYSIESAGVVIKGSPVRWPQSSLASFQYGELMPVQVQPDKQRAVRRLLDCRRPLVLRVEIRHFVTRLVQAPVHDHTVRAGGSGHVIRNQDLLAVQDAGEGERVSRTERKAELHP